MYSIKRADMRLNIFDIGMSVKNKISNEKIIFHTLCSMSLKLLFWVYFTLKILMQFETVNNKASLPERAQGSYILYLKKSCFTHQDYLCVIYILSYI